MAGKKGCSGGARPGAGRKPISWYVENGIAPGTATAAKLAEAPKWVRPERPCFVYVIHEDGADGVCKIGIAQAVSKRLNALQVAHWRPLVVAFSIQMSSEILALEVEKQVHSSFAHLHCRGEWYAVNQAAASAAVVDAASEVLDASYGREKA